MIERLISTKLAEVLQKSASVVLTGPRQVGKTTLALTVSKHIPSLYLDLENPLDLMKVQDFVSFFEANNDKLIILDEVQRLPEIFAPIRGIIDRERRQGNRYGLFLFLGSASIELLRQSGESLAGRITQMELYPVNLLEFAGNDPGKREILWLRGGFPESLLAKNNRESIEWRKAFIQTYLERDIPILGPRIPASTLLRFWTMLAHLQGSPFNAAQLARNFDVSGVTISRYLDLMVDLLLVRRLQPWSANIGKRLVKAPKVYVRDSGIAHGLLDIQEPDQLITHPVVGGSWEGWVIENILAITPFTTLPYYYRTSNGAEIDLILEWAGKDRWAIEIKKHSTPVLSKGFYMACEDIKPVKKFVIYMGKDTFTLPGDVVAISLFNFMEMLISYR